LFPVKLSGGTTAPDLRPTTAAPPRTRSAPLRVAQHPGSAAPLRRVRDDIH
jgi:hypothetical protein